MPLDELQNMNSTIKVTYDIISFFFLQQKNALDCLKIQRSLIQQCREASYVRKRFMRHFTHSRHKSAVVSRKAKQFMQRTRGRKSPDPGCHRPKGTARPVITPFVAGANPACESSSRPSE